MIQVRYSPGEGVTLQFRALPLGQMPGESPAHIRASVREFLLALRECLDAAIEAVEPEASTPREKIQVE
ncbi:MAG: hypothetical protein HYX99_04505 [Chloroflexi bacterium]|nr:hypothetical protein [Chloroflexota bacterium]